MGFSYTRNNPTPRSEIAQISISFFTTSSCNFGSLFIDPLHLKLDNCINLRFLWFTRRDEVMVRNCLPFMLAIFLVTNLSGTVRSQTTLSVGDVRVIGANSTAPDGFTILLFSDVSANTVLKFTDNGFLSADATGSNQFRGGENFLSIRFNSAATAGTVLRFTDSAGTTSVANSSNYSGTWDSTNVFNILNGISNSGDQIFIYQGTGFGASSTPSNVNVTSNTNPATFSGSLIYGLNFATTNNWLTTGSPSSNTSYLPSVLNTTDANITFGTTSTAQVYSGVRTGLTKAQFAAATSNSINWTGFAINQTLSTEEFTFGTSSDVYWDANGATVGDGGSGTWDSSTNNRFKNSESGTTFFRWIDSSSGNNHTAVFAGTAGTVTISGTVTPSNLRFSTSGYTLTGGTIALFGSSSTITTDTGVSASIGSTITGAAVVKDGAGTLTLSGTNTYSGNTTISNGTLALGASGSINSTPSITVGAGATYNVSAVSGGYILGSSTAQTLQGLGNVTGATTVASGSTVRGDSGAGTGSLTVGDLSINSGASLATQVTTDENVNSRLITGATNTINLISTGGRFNIQLLGDSVLTQNTEYQITLIQGATGTTYQRNSSAWDGTTNPFTTADFNLLGSFAGYESVSLTVVGNNLVLTFTPVPEPATIFGASALALGAFGLIRRRMKSNAVVAA
jgi:autotransporter-associated beta strand protein